ncbi:hypothetical protein NM688_g8789 [Phlebia brevispora]|uniref:Uncharacterized protein n=1 Tax=Phlebia brevispora TaxID=194682 RepID=A0ACC1RPR7_9APHY|nr:hypothetical protein NM688_g8789 [Phlebia brevispora]
MKNMIVQQFLPGSAEDPRLPSFGTILFPLGELPAELRSKIYKHIQTHGIIAMRQAALVCQEWYEVFFPIAHETLELEAYRHDDEESVVPGSSTDEATVLSWIHALASVPRIASVTRSLALTGPSLTRSYTKTIHGIAIRSPRLSLCLLAALLEMLPRVTNIHLDRVTWEPCSSLEGDPHRAHHEWLRTSISTLHLSSVHCIDPHIAHPLMVTKLFQSIEELFIEDIEGTEDDRDLSDLPTFDIKRMCLMRTDSDSYYLSNALHQCIPANSLQSLHIHDFTYDDIHLVVPLIFRHSGSLVRLHLCFLSQVDLHFPNLWNMLGIDQCNAISEFSIEIGIHSRLPFHFHDMFHLLITVLQNISDKMAKLEIWLDLDYTVGLGGADVLSPQGWSTIDDVCRRFSKLTHFTLGILPVTSCLTALSKSNVTFLVERGWSPSKVGQE